MLWCVTCTIDSHIGLKLSCDEQAQLQCEADSYNRCIQENMLVTVEFETLQEYLGLLELTAKKLSFLADRVSFYLAAAVSDFYIPDEKVRH